MTGQKARKSKFLIFLFNAYMAFWALYLVHWSGAKITPIDAVSNALLAFNLLVSAVLFLRVNFTMRLQVFLRMLNWAIVFFSIYGIASILGGAEHYVSEFADKKINNGSYLIGILRSFLPIYAFYFFSIRGILSKKMLRIWALILIGVSCASYFLVIVNNPRLINGIGSYTNNSSYDILGVMPLIFAFYDRKWLQYSLCVLCTVLILLGMKRGPMIIASILIIYLVLVNFRHARGWRKFLAMLVSAAFISGMGYYAVNLYETSEMMQKKMSRTMAGDSSGRDTLYSIYWDHFKEEGDPVKFFFGNGADSTLDIGFNYAHNDWFEILTNNGLVGVILFAAMWICFWKAIRNVGVHALRTILTAFYVVLLMQTFFSMSYSCWPTASTMCIGYCLAFAGRRPGYSLS